MNLKRSHILPVLLVAVLAVVAWRSMHRSPPYAAADAPVTVATAVGAPTDAKDELRLGSLTFQSCQIGEAGGNGSARAYCARFDVPEDWSVPQGRHISLRLAIIKSLAGRPDRDLAVFLDGGPGGAATEDYPAYAGAFSGLRKRRHILLIDQRGTGGSNALACEEGADSDTAGADPQLQPYLRDCLQKLAAHAAPRFYTTTLAVRDLEAVRQALGAPPLDLVGVSYGTRVAQRYAQSYPDAVRSMVLDSTVPNSLALGSEHARNLDAALRQRFDACVRNPECRQRFGDPYQSLFELRSRLRATPVITQARDPVTYELAQRRVTAADLAGTVRLFAYSAATAALLPLTIDEALKGNYAPLLGQEKLVNDALNEHLTGGMGLSVACAEDVDLLQPSSEDANTLLGNSLIEFLQRGCAIWPRGERPADFHQPFRSSLPVLVLAGQFDPVTPPRYGKEVADLLPNARLLTLAGQGHAVSAIGCTPRLIEDFVNALDAAGLDASCLQQLGDVPAFLEFSGAAP